MSIEIAEPYIPGETAVPSLGRASPAERKSPPLSAIQPHRDRYLMVGPERYCGREAMVAERDRLWPRVWLCAGRVSDVPEIGSWFRFDIGAESIIVVRRAADEIVALFNTCQHRGNQMVEGEFGRSAAFRCSYHSWTYDLGGRNRFITDREYFRAGALCGQLDMKRLRCETWGGNVFVNMDPDAPPLTEYLNEVIDVIEPYHMERMHVVQDVVVRLNCNWKIVLDAFSEAYHVHGAHPQAMPAAEDVKLQYDFYKYGHSRQVTPLGTPSPRLAPTEELNDALKGMLADVGVDPGSFTGGPGAVRRALQLAKRRPDNAYGLDYSELGDNMLTDDWAMNIFPNMQWNVHPEGILYDRYYPDADDPQKCRLHIMVLSPTYGNGARPPAYMGVPADADLTGATRPKRRYFDSDDPNLETEIGLLLYQDVRMVEAVQRGMRSRGFQAVRLSEQEQRNQHQFAEIDRYLLGIER